MKKLFFLAIVGVAAWYAWTHRDTLFKREGMHEAVVVNNAGEDLQRVRVVVNGQTLVREALAENQKASLPFKISADSDFQVTWQFTTKPGEMSWRGGTIAPGPMLQRHVFEIMADGSVLYHAESKGVAN
jgi:hypothetical protein